MIKIKKLFENRFFAKLFGELVIGVDKESPVSHIKAYKWLGKMYVTDVIEVKKRYPMCKDQPAQIDCRITVCKYHDNNGNCTNVSPAISLRPDKTFCCWSYGSGEW